MGLGTHLGLILVYLGGSIGFNSWLIKGFMDTISPSLDEAAKIDGATDYQIFSKIIAPLSRPILVVIFVITFIGIYSDFILAAIFLKDKNLWTVAVGINTVFIDDFNADWGVIAASSVIAATPIAILFIFFQNSFGPTSSIYWIAVFLLVVVFTFFSETGSSSQPTFSRKSS